MLLLWDRVKVLKNSGVPVPLLVVLFGAGLNALWQQSGSSWTISPSHLVQVPVAENLQAAVSLLTFPDWSFLSKPATYTAAITLAIVASLETLLNLEAIDRIDPEGRISPPNRELVAQGVGNMTAGLIGGLPMTSVIVRSSVNINARNSSRYSAVFHGFLLCGSVLLMPQLLNKIPLACLAAILITTGLKLASPKLVKQMWQEGRRQFLPFASTVIAIVAIDLLKGVVIGLIISVFFILHSNFRRPLSRTVEKHAAGNVTRIELSNQVSFFSRATFERAFAEVPAGGHVLIDARNSVYIDPDILDIIHDFRTSSAPARGIALSFLGLKDHYAELEDRIEYVEHSSPWTSPVLRLDELKEPSPVSPCITDQQSVSEPMKLDRESLAPVSIHVQLEKAWISPPPPSSLPDPNMECISSTLSLDEPKVSLVVPSPIIGQQVGSKNEESLVVLSSIIGQQLGSENGELLVIPSPITEQQVGSGNGELHVLSPITEQQLESENGELLVVSSAITEQQVGNENGELNVLSPNTEQQLVSENGELLVISSAITGQQVASKNGKFNSSRILHRT